MGSLTTITLYADSAEQAQQGFLQAFARIAELNRILSDYNPSSEISTSCEQPKSADLRAVLDLARAIHDQSEGAFDIYAGAVTHLWRRARRDKQMPSRDDIQRAMHSRGSICDAGGIAKGYAADEALATLRAFGIPRALVAMSGDIAIGDPPPGKPGWRVRAAGGVHTLSNAGVSTSGDEYQGFNIGSVRYSHIIDPRTGQALRNAPSVSVIARTAAEADAAATAISVGGQNTARRLQATRKLQIFIGPSSSTIGPTPQATPAQ